MREYGEWRCSSSILDLGTLEKQPQVPHLQEAGLDIWRRENLLLLPGVESRFLGFVTISTDGRTELLSCQL
jgi:hypothetical protein